MTSARESRINKKGRRGLEHSQARSLVRFSFFFNLLLLHLACVWERMNFTNKMLVFLVSARTVGTLWIFLSYLAASRVWSGEHLDEEIELGNFNSH